MGKLLKLATVFQTVAYQLSQPQTALRQCGSCPYPFRDRAPTVALSREGCWRGNCTGANSTRSVPHPTRWFDRNRRVCERGMSSTPYIVSRRKGSSVGCADG